MHVALVLMTGNPEFAGGVPGVVMQRAKFLRDAGHQVTIVCGNHGGWKHFEVRDGIHIYPVKPYIAQIDAQISRRLATRSILFLRRLGWALELEHAKRPIDLVDLQDGPAILGANRFCRKHKVPLTFTIHSSAALNPAPRPWIGRKLHIYYESLAWKAAKLVFPVSQFIASVGARYGDYQSKVRVVPNSILGEWLEKGRSKNLNLDPRAPLRLLFLSRIDPGKRLIVALGAMLEIPAEVATLEVMGGGPLEEEAKRFVEENGLADRVRFHGFVYDREKVEAALESADVFVFPTQFEAWSVALLEAMAFGLATIASDIPSNREVLGDIGLFPYDDHQALRAAVLDYAQNREKLIGIREAMVARAAHFVREDIYAKLMEAYEEAAINPTTP